MTEARETAETTETTETTETRTLFDFAAGAEPWGNIDDRVMGGVSASRMVVEEGRGVFRGTVSLENNGGFASVRSAPRRLDLSGFTGVAVTVRGDGKRYKLRLRQTGAFDGVSWQAPLETAADGDWTTLRVPFSAFEPVFRGRPVRGAPPLDPAQVRTVGLLISDGQEGPFRLEVRQVAAYRDGI